MHSHTKKFLILLILILAGSLVAWYFMFRVIKQNVEKAYEIETAIKIETERSQKLNELKSAFSKIDSDISVLLSRLINIDGTVTFIEDVETLARASGVSAKIDSVTEDQVGLKSKEFTNLQLIISTEGSWKQTYTFLQMIENLPYKASIQSVSLNHSEYEQAGKKTSSKPSLWRGLFKLTVLKKK